MKEQRVELEQKNALLEQELKLAAENTQRQLDIKAK